MKRSRCTADLFKERSSYVLITKMIAYEYMSIMSHKITFSLLKIKYARIIVTASDARPPRGSPEGIRRRDRYTILIPVYIVTSGKIQK